MGGKRIDFASLAVFYLNLPQTNFTIKDLDDLPTPYSKGAMLKLLVDLDVVEIMGGKNPQSYRKKPLTNQSKHPSRVFKGVVKRVVLSTLEDIE